MLSAEAARLLHLTFRLPRFLYRSNESGTKAAILPFDTVTSATISVDPMYDLRLAPPGRKNTAREALRSDRFLWEQKVAKKVKVLWQLLVGNFGQ